MVTAMTPLLQYVYVSTARKLFDQRELDSLLDGSRAFNTEHGVTGILVYADGNFFQVLEGEEPAIDLALARIQRDPRHYGITRLVRHEIAQRSFPGWSMGYRRLSRGQAQRDGWFDYASDPIGHDLPGAAPASPGVLLARGFVNANR